MRVVEIFGGIQGEGLNTGRPTIFIRFAGCNLKCNFCDTAYHRTESHYLTVEEILDKLSASLVDNITLTGGEPFIQDKKEMLQLIDGIHKLGKKVFVETNGVIFDKDYWDRIDYFSISPKLSTSGNCKLNYVKGVSQYLKNELKEQKDFETEGCGCGCSSGSRNLKLQLKFVISNQKDIKEVKTILNCGRHRLHDSTIPVIFQPCTNTQETLESYSKKAQQLVEWIQDDEDFYDYDFRVMLQQHFVIHGRRRGV